MDKYEKWLIDNGHGNKVISGTEKQGYYYTSDAMRDYEKEKMSNLLYALLADVRAWLKQNGKDPVTFYVDEQVVSVDRLDDFLFKYISEHFS